MTDLTAAAEAILAEIETTSQWEQELLTDLERTRLKQQDLRRALTSVLQTLPAAARNALRDRVSQSASPSIAAHRPSANATDKVEALHAYLRTAEPIVSVKAVQHHLKSLALASYPDAAAILLARKAKQGVVERVARGRYRVNFGHPMLAG